MRVVSLNVRNPSFQDAENAWPHRREAFFEVLRRLNPDVLCLQETIVAQVEEIQLTLGFDKSFGLPREDGENAEMCAVLVRGLSASCSDTEWLCETPKVPGSKGWGAACSRVVTRVDFGDWVVFNAHLDHVSLDARTNGMRQIVGLADSLGKPCLIAGDFNAEPSEPALAIAREAGFVDFADGTGTTFHDFHRGSEVRIDYVLGRGAWEAERAWVERTEAAYSDHDAVVVDLSL